MSKIYETCTDCENGIREFDNSESIAVAAKCTHCEKGKIEVEPDVLAKEFAEWGKKWETHIPGIWWNRELDTTKSTDELFTDFLTEKGYTITP